MFLVACASPAEEDTSSPSCIEAADHSDLAWIQDNIFTPSCAFSSCHSGAAAQAGHLNLQAGAAHGQLVDMPTTSAGSGWMRVVPGESDKSYLLVAIGQVTGPSPKGGTMPLSSAPLCDAKKEAIERWVAAGAPQ